MYFLDYLTKLELQIQRELRLHFSVLRSLVLDAARQEPMFLTTECGKIISETVL